MECPYCKQNVDIKELWLKKPFRKKFKDFLIYCEHIVLPEEKPSELNYSTAILSFSGIIGLFLVVIIGSLFIVYPDYKASGNIWDLLGWPTAFFLIGFDIALIFFGICYFLFQRNFERLFKKGLFSIQCPHCKKEVGK